MQRWITTRVVRVDCNVRTTAMRGPQGRETGVTSRSWNTRIRELYHQEEYHGQLACLAMCLPFSRRPLCQGDHRAGEPCRTCRPSPPTMAARTPRGKLCMRDRQLACRGRLVCETNASSDSPHMHDSRTALSPTSYSPKQNTHCEHRTRAERKRQASVSTSAVGSPRPS